jgi:hypothetical protein
MAGLMNNESEKIWKEGVLAYTRYYPSIFLEVLSKNPENFFKIFGEPTEIRREYLPHKSKGKVIPVTGLRGP